MGRHKHINQTRAEDITCVYNYLEKQNSYGTRSSLGVYGKSKTKLYDITGEIFSVSRSSVRRIVNQKDCDGASDSNELIARWIISIHRCYKIKIFSLDSLPHCIHFYR